VRCATSSASTAAARSSESHGTVRPAPEPAGVAPRWPNLHEMETKTKRTLVKSAPELWELADEEARMEAWMGGLVGITKPIPVEVTDREPERILAWRARNCAAPGPSPRARIAIELAEKGFGTSVSITAQHAAPDPAAAITALERLLDELASPERRPFTRG